MASEKVTRWLAGLQTSLEKVGRPCAGLQVALRKVEMLFAGLRTYSSKSRRHFQSNEARWGESFRECAALGTLSDLRAIGIETLDNTEEEAVCMHPSERSGADGCKGLV